MLDHIHIMDQRMQKMSSAMEAMGAEIDDQVMPEIEDCELDDDDQGDR